MFFFLFSQLIGQFAICVFCSCICPILKLFQKRLRKLFKKLKPKFDIFVHQQFWCNATVVAHMSMSTVQNELLSFLHRVELSQQTVEKKSINAEKRKKNSYF